MGDKFFNIEKQELLNNLTSQIKVLEDTPKVFLDNRKIELDNLLKSYKPKKAIKENNESFYEMLIRLKKEIKEEPDKVIKDELSKINKLKINEENTIDNTDLL